MTDELKPTESTESTRMPGTIRRILEGYGFIAGNDGIDYFFHWQSMSKFTKQLRYCRAGEPVTFEIELGDRGPRAINIEVVGHTINRVAGK